MQNNYNYQPYAHIHSDQQSRIDGYLYAEQSKSLMGSEQTLRAINFVTFAVKEQILFLRQLKQMAEEVRLLDINVVALFQVFSGDKFDQILIDKFDFRDVMQKHTNPELTRLCDVELLFSTLNDYQSSASISYYQFHRILTKYGRCVTGGEQINMEQRGTMVVGEQQMQSVVRFINLILRMQMNLEYVRQTMNNQMMNLVVVFQMLDRDMDGFVRSQDVQRFLSEQEVIISSEEAAHYLMLMDVSGRGRVQLQHFLAYFHPKSQAVYE